MTAGLGGGIHSTEGFLLRVDKNWMELDRLPSMVMPLPAVTLTFWPNHYVSQAQLHMRPDGEISSNIYKDIVFTRFFGSLPTVTLTFDFLILKSNQHIYEPKYTWDQNWVKLHSLVFEIWCRLPAMTFTFNPLT